MGILLASTPDTVCEFSSVKYLLVHRPINHLFKSARSPFFAISKLSLSLFLIFIMHNKPKVLILGHFFVHHFKSSIYSGHDQRVKGDLYLSQSPNVCFHGVGGHTVDKLCFWPRYCETSQTRHHNFWSGLWRSMPSWSKAWYFGSQNRGTGPSPYHHCHVCYVMVCQVINLTIFSRLIPHYTNKVAILRWFTTVFRRERWPF